MPIQKKKQSRFTKLGARLKTPKGRLVATVLMFAVIGGGIFVYKSFAATGATFTWNYTINSGTAETRADGLNCKGYNPQEAQKNNMKIHEFICARGGNGVAQILGSYLPANYANRNYRICAYVKGSGKFTTQIYYKDIPGTIKGTSYNINTGSYGYYCSPYSLLTKASRVDGVVLVGYAGANIRVGTINLEMQ